MDLAQHPDAAILAVVEPIMDNLMDASTAIDYERHVRDFTERARSVLPGSIFETVCRQYQAGKGRFAGRTLVGIFRRPDSVAVVWRQAFTVAPGEFVAELVLVQQDGRYRVDHVMVF